MERFVISNSKMTGIMKVTDNQTNTVYAVPGDETDCVRFIKRIVETENETSNETETKEKGNTMRDYYGFQTMVETYRNDITKMERFLREEKPSQTVENQVIDIINRRMADLRTLLFSHNLCDDSLVDL